MRHNFAGTVSEKNSSSTALGSSETFTGAWEDVSMFHTVSFACRANATGTLYVDFTSDINSGTTDSTLTYKIAANINEVHRLTITRRFFRIRLVNDSTAQTYLSLSTCLGNHPQLSAPLNLNVGLDADATVVRPSIPEDEIVIGKRSGVRPFTKFGYVEALTAAGGEQVIWSAGATTAFTPMTTASTFTIAYNSTTDGSDGGATGATSLYIQYIDANGLNAEAVHVLSNTGSDVTSFTGLGINRIAVSASGSSNTNVNDITITETTGATTQAHIPAGQGVTQQLIYFVSSNAYAVGKFLWINTNKLSGGGSPRVVIKAYVFNRNVETTFEVFRVTVDTNTQTIVEFTEPVGFRLTPTDVIYFVADTDTNNAIVNARFSIVEYDND